MTTMMPATRRQLQFGLPTILVIVGLVAVALATRSASRTNDTYHSGAAETTPK